MSKYVVLFMGKTHMAVAKDVGTVVAVKDRVESCRVLSPVEADRLDANLDILSCAFTDFEAAGQPLDVDGYTRAVDEHLRELLEVLG